VRFIHECSGPSESQPNVDGSYNPSQNCSCARCVILGYICTFAVGESLLGVPVDAGLTMISEAVHHPPQRAIEEHTVAVDEAWTYLLPRPAVDTTAMLPIKEVTQIQLPSTFSSLHLCLS
jgi:hypothetical protein